MTFELDPDLRLAVRMTLGRGWRLGVSLGSFAMVIAALAWFRNPVVDFARIAWPEVGDPLHVVVIVVLMIAPTIPLGGYLLELERRGLLDSVRLCGRSPHRLLLLLLVGLALPLVLSVLLVALPPPGVHLSLGVVRLGLVMGTAALDVALIIFGTLPAAAAAEGPAVLTGAAAMLALAAVMVLPVIGWLPVQPSSRLQLIALVLVFAGFPIAVRVACRRLGRPAQRAAATKVSRLVPALARVAPHARQPEFTRCLRSTAPLAIGGAVGIGAMALAAVIVARYNATAHPVTSEYVGPYVLLTYLAPCMIVLLGAAKLSDLVRREFESGTIDLVRLAAQSPRAIGLGWYAGAALPFAVAALPPALVALYAAPASFPIPRPLVAWGQIGAAAALPALTFASTLSRRTGAYRVVYVPLAILTAVAIPRAGWALVLRAREFDLWQVGPIGVIPALITWLALAVGVGRLRRPYGPALIGVHAVAAIVAITVCARVLPLDMFPRLVIVLLALSASWVAEDRTAPTPPWRRLATAGGAAMAGSLIAIGRAGLGMAAILTTIACATLAAGIGMLAYEVRDRPALSFGLPIVMVVSATRLPWLALREAIRVSVPLPPIPPLSVDELAVLAATFVAMAIAHARARATNAAAGR